MKQSDACKRLMWLIVISIVVKFMIILYDFYDFVILIDRIDFAILFSRIYDFVILVYY